MASELQLPQAGMFLQEQDQEGGLRLDRFVSALKRHVLLIAGVTTLTASAAVLKAVTDTPTFQSHLELLTPPVTLETQIISGLNPEALSNQSDVVSVAIDETKLKILTSPRVMEPILDELQSKYPDITYRELLGNLRITPDDTGNTLKVHYQSQDPQQVLDVLEVISVAYLKYSLEDRQNDIYRGIDFVDEQLPSIRERVENLEAELESLRQRYNLIDPLLQGEQLTEQAAKFTSQQLDLRVQIEQTQKLYLDLQREITEGEELASTSALQESDRYQAILDQLLVIDSQLAEDLTLYLEDSPEIEVVEEHRANLQPLLEREAIRVQAQIASYVGELLDRDQALSETIGTLNQRIKRLSSAARQYNDIQRELEIATTNLNQFLTKREALRIDAAQRQTPWEILTPPSEPKASSASAKSNLVLGSLLGLMLGATLAISVDRMRGRIHTVEELKEVARIPILGNIPRNHLLENGQSLALPINQLSGLEQGPGFLLEAQNSEQALASTPFLEAFRILSTSIRLSSPDSPVKVLTIGSAIANSGKSTISFHLAYANASMGQRTLLVDTDLRRPSLHEYCDVSNTKGLSNYATGDCDFEDIVVSLPVDENLFLIPSGPIPPNPIRILSSQKMRDFFREINERFDMVIFDTPPMLGFADAFIIAEKTQGLLLTACLGQIKFSQMQSVMDELQIAKIPIIGMVANGSTQESEGSYDYYQYYQQSMEEANATLNRRNSFEADETASRREGLFSLFSKRP